MNTKSKMLRFFTFGSAAVLLAALFMPLFWGILLVDVVSLSVWGYSHLIAIFSGIVIQAIVWLPLVRSSAKAWILPFIFGGTLVIGTLCAAIYSFPIKDNLSNVFFHPYGLIIFALGGIFCVVEGLLARPKFRAHFVA